MVLRSKGNLNEETCTVKIDFAEHFVSTHGEEIQSAYFKTNMNVHDEEMEEDVECLLLRHHCG